MPAHRYRSQPTLQRTSRGPGARTLGLWLTVTVVGGGVLVSALRGAPPAPPYVSPVAPPPLAASPPAPAPVATAKSDQTPAAAQPAVIAAAAPQAQATTLPATPAVKLARTQVKAVRPAKRAKASPTLLAQQQATWEKQHQAYVLASAAYEANERTAGYQWAQQHAITIRSYCSVAAQRTPAFAQGCLNYAAQSTHGDKT